MGKFGNFRGTTETTWWIRDCRLVPWYTAIGSGRQWDLPNFSGDVPVVDSGGTLRWGGGSGPPWLLRHMGSMAGGATATFRVVGYDPFDNGVSGPERVPSRLDLFGSLGAFGEKLLASLRGFTNMGDSSSTELRGYVYGSGTEVMAIRVTHQLAQLPRTLVLKDPLNTYTNEIAGALAPTAGRTHQLQDASGTVAHMRDALSVDFLDGFEIRVRSTDIVVGAGSCKFPNQTIEDAAIDFPAITLNPSRATATTYHLYANRTTGQVERSTTSPTAGVFGRTGRFATGNQNLRYLGTVRTSSSTYLEGYVAPGTAGVTKYLFTHNAGLRSRIIGSGASATPADVNMASFGAPPNATVSGLFRIQNTNAGDTLRYYVWNGAAFGVYSNIAGAGISVPVEVLCDATPKIQYDMASGLVGAFIDLLGYTFMR